MGHEGLLVGEAVPGQLYFTTGGLPCHTGLPITGGTTSMDIAPSHDRGKRGYRCSRGTPRPVLTDICTANPRWNAHRETNRPHSSRVMVTFPPNPFRKRAIGEPVDLRRDDGFGSPSSRLFPRHSARGLGAGDVGGAQGELVSADVVRARPRCPPSRQSKPHHTSRETEDGTWG